MRRIAVALTLLVSGFGAHEARAQQDSVTVTVINRSDVRLEISPAGPIVALAGDSVQFAVVAIDTVSGDTLDVSVSWSTSSPGVVDINASGLARFLARGVAVIYVDVVEILSLIFLTQEDTGRWVEAYQASRAPQYAAAGITPDALVMDVGTSRPMCVYAETTLGTWLAVPLDDLRSTNPAVVEVVHDPLQAGCPTWRDATAPLSPAFQLMYRTAQR